MRRRPARVKSSPRDAPAANATSCPRRSSSSPIAISWCTTPMLSTAQIKILMRPAVSRGVPGARRAWRRRMSPHPGLEAFTSPTTEVTDQSLAARLFAACDARANLPADICARIANASKVMARAFHLMRRVALDESPLLRLHDTIAAQACQFTSTSELAALVPPPHPIWTKLGALLVEVTNATAIEGAFVAGYRQLATLDRETATRLAAARTAHTTFYPYVLAALSPTFDPGPLASAVRNLMIAARTLGDLGSWKRDVATGRPSVVVAGLALVQPITTPAEQSRLYQQLVATGHLRGVVELATAHLQHARDACCASDDAPLVSLIAELEAKTLAVRDALPRG